MQTKVLPRHCTIGDGLGDWAGVEVGLVEAGEVVGEDVGLAVAALFPDGTAVGVGVGVGVGFATVEVLDTNGLIIVETKGTRIKTEFGGILIGIAGSGRGLLSARLAYSHRSIINANTKAR